MVQAGGQSVGRLNEKMRFAWWNTHLTPPMGDPLQAEERDLVLEVIAVILSICDILFVGEVSSQDLDWLSNYFRTDVFDIIDNTKGPSNENFNIGAIYNRHNAEYIGNIFNLDKRFTTLNVGDTKYKVSCHMEFAIKQDYLFSFLVSHWASRLFLHEDSPTRGYFGAALRGQVNILLNQGLEHLILLGDYNDEPFNLGMTKHLRGCRDAAFVTRHPHLLYNPFWKHIACPKGYARPPITNEPVGTYFFRQDKLQRWRVFDQMLFSSSFVGSGDWQLSETGTGVLRYTPLVQAVESPRYKLDHLPIMGELQKETADG